MRATNCPLCLFQEWNKKNVFQRTQSFVGYPVNSQNKIVFEEDIAHNGEEVDEDESQHSCQNNGAAVAGYTLYYVQQSLFSINQIKELETGRSQRYVFSMWMENMQNYVCALMWASGII